MTDFNSPEFKSLKESIAAAALRNRVSYNDFVTALALVAGDEANTLRTAAGVLNRSAQTRNVGASLEADANRLAQVNQLLVSTATSVERLGVGRSTGIAPGFVEFDVDSTVISKLLYDFKTSTLRVVFHNVGRFNTNVWEYTNVSRDEFESLRDAGSVGSYYGRNIKGQYNSAPVVSGVARPDLLPAGYKG